MKKILFIHQSTGANLIKEGGLRGEISKIDPTIEFWDHSFNFYPSLPLMFAKFTYRTGLVDPRGCVTGEDYNIVLSNHSPKEYAEIFSRSSDDKTLKSILNYDLIAFKNCFPTTRITSDKQLQENKAYYQSIRDSVKKYPKNQFVLVTPPPLRKESTNADNAQRAKELIAWLKSDDFLQGASNLHVFDFFGYLADENGFLKKEYTRFLPWDSHPNKAANKEIAPIFAKYLITTASL